MEQKAGKGKGLKHGENVKPLKGKRNELKCGETGNWNRVTKGKEKQKSLKREDKGFCFGFGLYCGIKFRRSGLYGGDRAIIYFIFIRILKLIKIILKLLDKFRKDDGNDMATDVA